MSRARSEPGEPCEVDHESADVWRPFRGAANDAAVAEPDVEHIDLVFGEPFKGGHVRRVAGAAFEVHDAPCGDGVEGGTLAQVVGVIELAILDPGADLEDPEVFLDGPARLVPCDGTPGVVDVGFPSVVGNTQWSGALPFGGSGSKTETASMASGAASPVLSVGGARSIVASRSSSRALRLRRLRGPPQGRMVMV